jgi:hypothetical protein
MRATSAAFAGVVSLAFVGNVGTARGQTGRSAALRFIQLGQEGFVQIHP